MMLKLKSFFQGWRFASAVSSALLCATFLAACGGESAPTGDAQSASKHIERAQTYRDEGQYRAALIEAQNAVEKSADKAAAYATLASIYNDLGDHQAAVESTQKLGDELATEALKLEKLDAYLSQGRIRSARTVLDDLEMQDKTDNVLELGIQKAIYLRSVGDIDAASLLYQELIAQHPDSLDLRLDSIEFDLLRGENESANLALSELDKNVEGSSKYLYLKGVSHIKQQQLAPAELRLNEALALRNADDVSTPARLQIQIQLERLLDLQGRSVEASQLREQMLVKDVDMSEAKINEALRLFEAGDVADALNVIGGVLDKQPNSAVANLLKGAMLYQQRQNREAADLFDQYLDFELYNPELVQVGANAMLDAGYQQKLIDKLTAYEGLENDALALKFYARALMAQQEQAPAANAFSRAIAVDPVDTESYLFLDSLYQQHESLSEDLGPVSEKLSQGLIALDKQQRASGKSSRVGREYLELARALAMAKVREGDVAGAQAFVDAEREATNSNAETLHLAAILAAAQDDAAKARDFARASLEKDPSDADLWFALANAERQTGGSFASVRKALTSGVELRAGDGPSYYRAMSYAESDTQLDALAQDLVGVSERYQQAVGLRAIGRSYLDRGRADTANIYLQQFREKLGAPSAAPRLARRIAIAGVQAQWEAGDREAAFSTLNAAIDGEPAATDLLSLMVRLHASNKDYASANRWTERLAEIDQVAGLVHQAEVEKLQGNADKALGIYQSAWQLSPQDPIGLAIYSLLGPDDAEGRSSFLESWEQAVPESGARLQLMVGDALRRGDTQQAVTLSEQLLKINPENYMAMNNLAWLYQSSGDSRALQLAKRAYSLAPDEPQVLDTYGWILTENGKAGEAIPLFERALTLAPEDDSIKSNLEKAQRKL